MTAKTMWMVRAGEAGFRFEEFKDGPLVSIGWLQMGDMRSLKSREDFQKAVVAAYPTAKKGQVGAYAGQAYRFVREIKVGDAVVTYDRSERIYLVGNVAGEYEYAPNVSEAQPNIRRVRWRGNVARDALSVSARNSLGSISTLFVISAEAAAAAEIEQHLSGVETGEIGVRFQLILSTGTLAAWYVALLDASAPAPAMVPPVARMTTLGLSAA